MRDLYLKTRVLSAIEIPLRSLPPVLLSLSLLLTRLLPLPLHIPHAASHSLFPLPLLGNLDLFPPPLLSSPAWIYIYIYWQLALIMFDLYHTKLTTSDQRPGMS